MTGGATKWPMRPLGELVDILDSRRVPVSANERSKRPGEVPYYGASGPVGTIDKHIFDEPLLLLGEDGVQFFDSGKSKSYLIEGPAWVNNHAHVLRARPTVERKFLNYYLNHCDYRGFANGTTRLKLTQAAMRQIPVPVPPIDEQRRTVDLLEDHLSRLDVADRAVRQSIKRLDRLRDAALAKAVGDTRSDPPTRVLRLGELARVSTGTTPLRGNTAFYENGTIPWITSGDLHQGLISRASQFVTPLALTETSLKLVPAGSLLIAMYGEGRTRGTVAELAIEATTNQACASVELHEAALRAWVRLVLDANYNSMRRMAAGGVQPNLNLSLVRSIEVPVPTLAAQETAIAHVSEVSDAREQLATSLGSATKRGANLRRALLAAAFSGRLIGGGVDASMVKEMITA